MTVVLPSCVDGIATGCILTVGRIVGESAAPSQRVSPMINGFSCVSKRGATLTVAFMFAKEQGEFDVALL